MLQDIRVSLAKWLNSPGKDRILDLRTRQEFCKIHLKHATNIPYEELSKRWFELPHRSNPFTVILPKGMEEIPDRLQEWTITEAFPNTSEFWEVAKSWNLVSEAPENSSNLLFSPCPFLEETIGVIESTLIKSKPTENGKAPVFACCDVGCGSGRDVAWLCSRPEVEWHAYAVDSWLGSLDRTRQLANSLNISKKVTTCGVKFTSEGAVKSVDSGRAQYTHEEASFLTKQFDLVICIRFLERSCFSLLDNLVAPGGFLLYSTFVDGDIEFEKPSGKNHRLVLGELKENFGQIQGYKILQDKIEYIEDGRPVNSFLAQKSINERTC